MDRKIKDLKVGTRLQFGRYTCDPSPNAAGVPIIWLKASPNCDFISEYALDSLVFDARERGSPINDHKWYGNNTYELSNIYQFLNSEDAVWFHNMHEYDVLHGDYANRRGFLYAFEPYEIAAISGGVQLPEFNDIFNVYGSNFALFKRKGIRPHPSQDFRNRFWREGYEASSYVSYWTSTPKEASTRVHVVGRDGYGSSAEPAHRAGLRPKCRISGDLIVDITADGVYTLRAFEVDDTEEVYSDDDLFSFLGLR